MMNISVGVGSSKQYVDQFSVIVSGSMWIWLFSVIVQQNTKMKKQGVSVWQTGMSLSCSFK